jgi:hypothetical protein
MLERLDAALVWSFAASERLSGSKEAVMGNPGGVIVAVVTLGILFVLIPQALYTFHRFRRARALACPRTGERVRLDIDAPRAAVTSVFGRPRLRVGWCTLWPQRQGCAQECLASPEVEKPAPQEIA